MIVPLGDLVSELVCRRRQEFLNCSKLMLVPYETFRLGRDKVETLKAAARCGVPIPKTWYPEEQELDEIAAETAWPVLVKPAIANGARGIHFVHAAAQLKQTYADVQASFGRTFVQELIPHKGLQYKVDLILGHDGELLAGVVYSKIRYYPASGGSSVLNETVDRPDILEHAARLARSLGWFGLCDFDFIQDVRDNTPKLMEINPRFPESFRMCEAAGVDFPRILYRLASGETVLPQLNYRKGRYLRFLPGDLLWFFTVGNQRWHTRPSFFNFFDPRTTDQLISLRDLGPIIGYVVENFLVFLDPRERAFRFRMEAARKAGHA